MLGGDGPRFGSQQVAEPVRLDRANTFGISNLREARTAGSPAKE